MKTIYWLLFLSCLCYLQASQAQALEKKTLLLEAYLGAPLFYEVTLRHLTTKYVGQSTGKVDNRFFVWGPIGARAEYMLTRHIGVGGDIGYDYAMYRVIKDFSPRHYYKVISHRVSLLARANYHFGKDDDVDWYVGGGLGYKATWFDVSSSDLNVGRLKTILNENKDKAFIYRVAVGGHYFLSDDIGLNYEIGYGGPIFTIGFSTRL